MAQGASNEKALGDLHGLLTKVFMKVLKKYETQLDAVQTADFESEVVEELMDVAVEPTPAMLSAISKFLKDNSIAYDTEDLNKLSTQERRIAAMRKSRGASVVSLKDLAHVG